MKTLTTIATSIQVMIAGLYCAVDMHITDLIVPCQIVLYTVHLSLLLVAKRTLMCRDLGEQHVAPGFDVDQEANPLNRCCRRVHKTAFSEHNRVSDAVSKLVARTVFLVCAVTSIWVPFTQAVILFDIIAIWPRLKDTTQALTSAIPKVQSQVPRSA